MDKKKKKKSASKKRMNKSKFVCQKIWGLFKSLIKLMKKLLLCLDFREFDRKKRAFKGDRQEESLWWSETVKQFNTTNRGK